MSAEQTELPFESVGVGALYREIVADLRARVVGHDEAVQRLALAGVRHLLGRGKQRLILTGPSGSGKTTLLTSLAEVLQVPHLVIDVSSLAETNWQGFDLADAARTLFFQAGSVSEMQRSLIVLDELDKVASRKIDGVGRDYRVGKQQSLLPLLGGGLPIRFEPRKDSALAFVTDNCLIVGAGVFAGLPPGRLVSPRALIRLGLMPELVERFGSVLRLEPLGRSHLCAVLRTNLAPIDTTFRDFGFLLDVPDTTLLYAAAAAEQPDLGAGPRSVATWIADAAERRLVALLEAGRHPGSVITITPDDVQVPGTERQRPPVR